ncbi:MAG TPA: hypothetical protein VE775_05435, partial [Pyrinomonadaceae bacterium]|nr:hypothetical protein [Pyrinomonadaceae bacterium]
TRGVDYNIDNATGLVTFLAGHFPANGAALTATYDFQIPVRYGVKELPSPQLFLWRTTDATGLVGAISIPLVEIRDYQ